jgi:hypothetical protein
MLFFVIACKKEQMEEFPSVVTNLSPEAISSRTIVINGTITSKSSDSITVKGIAYNTNPNPTVSNFRTINGHGSGNFTSKLTGLNPGTTYYLKAYVTTKAGTAYGNQMSLKTPVFDFNWLDEDGKELLSRNSEYLILIPDIQNYITNTANNIYLEQIVDWVIDFNNIGFRVKATIQVGDVTNLNTIPEWTNAHRILSKLDNKIDYILCPGNHDYGDNGSTNSRKTYFSDFFKYSGNKSFVSSFETDNFENTYFNLTIQDQPYQIFSLEFGPRDKVVEWANNLAKANPEKIGILLTHAYLFKNKERYEYPRLYSAQNISPYNYALIYPQYGKEKVNDGEELWKKFIFPNSKMRLVFCGHKTAPDYVGNLISRNKDEKQVLQMLFNTQDFPKGGDGWIQILEFPKDNKSIRVSTYSTLHKTWNREPLNQFSFNIE